MQTAMSLGTRAVPEIDLEEIIETEKVFFKDGHIYFCNLKTKLIRFIDTSGKVLQNVESNAPSIILER